MFQLLMPENVYIMHPRPPQGLWPRLLTAPPHLLDRGKKRAGDMVLCKSSSVHKC